MLSKIIVLEEEMAAFAIDYPINNNHEHYRSHAKYRLEFDKVINRQEDILNQALPQLTNL